MARFEEISDVSFMGDITLEGLKKKIVEEYNAAYLEITGENKTAPDEQLAIMYAAAALFYQLAEAINSKAKQNLLKYSSGTYLDNIGISRGGLTRKQAESAVVMVRFTASAVRQNVIGIPEGTRVTGGSGRIYFATTEYAEIAPGEEYVDVPCMATAGGAAANDFEIGELNMLVDPIAYIGSVSNTDAPTGGTDAESDDAFAERIYDSRYTYSTAGAEQAYIYYTKAFSTLIDDVVVLNPSDANIDIYILMADRTQATSAFLEELENYLDDPDIKPLTDNITVKNVTRVNYAISVEYKIYDTDLSKLAEIQKAIAAAAEEFKTWQSARIGRDISSQKLISLLIAAGAAQVTINSPPDTKVEANEIAYCESTSIEYKGYIEE